MLNTPVLFLIFNRPEITARVFQEIRRAKPARLYIAADGPRLNHPDDQELCNRTRQVCDSIDWGCEVKTLFQDENLGCRNAVSTAINWFFEDVEEGIILEDDCLPEPSFFQYCEELLDHFRNDSRIMAISGDNFQDGISRTEYSYYFSRYPHCWGWATWKAAWEKWDGDLTDWEELRDSFFFNSVEKINTPFYSYWTKIFDDVKKGKIDSWNYPWIYSCWVQNGLTVLPDNNLVRNIGFGEHATHTKDDSNAQSQIPTHEITFPLSHPPFVLRNSDADSYFETNGLGLVSSTVNVDNYFTAIFKKLIKVFLPTNK